MSASLFVSCVRRTAEALLPLPSALLQDPIARFLDELESIALA
jgi:hypothetical protein